MGPWSNMIGGFTKRKDVDTGTAQGECHDHVEIKTEIDMMLPQPKNTRDVQPTTRTYGRGLKQIFAHSPYKKPNLRSLWSQTFGFQNCETIHFCYSKTPSMCDTLLHQPCSTNPHTMFLLALPSTRTCISPTTELYPCPSFCLEHFPSLFDFANSE